MLDKTLVRLEPRVDEAEIYIRDTLAVLARLADDIKSPRLAVRLRAAFYEPLGDKAVFRASRYNRLVLAGLPG